MRRCAAGLEAEEEVTVKSLEPRASGWFDLDSLPIMQEARRNRLAAAKTGFDMGVPFNELNRVLDLGFKALPWGDRGYLAAKLQEVGNDSPKSKVQSPKSEPRVDSGELIADRGDPLAQAEQLFCKLRDYQLPTHCYPLLRKLRRFLFEQRQRALARLTAVLSRVGQDGPTNQTSETSQTSPLPPLLDLAAETAQLTASLQPLLAAENWKPCQAALEQFDQVTLAAVERARQEGLARGETRTNWPATSGRSTTTPRPAAPRSSPRPRWPAERRLQSA